MEKIWSILKFDLICSLISMFVMAFATPIINIYMISNVDPQYYKLSIGIDYLGGAIFGLYFSKRLRRYRKYINLFSMASAISILLINIFFAHLPSARFIIMSLTNTIAATFVGNLLDNYYSNIIKGDDMSEYYGKMNAMASLGGLGGMILAMFVTVDINTALTIQCVAAIFESFRDITVAKRLKPMINNRKIPYKKPEVITVIPVVDRCKIC